MDEIIDYIKSFLVYGNEAAAKHIGYTADELDWQHYKLVIVPGKNILTGERREWTAPNLQEPAHAVKQGEFFDEFGEKMGGTWVIREDIIYNTFYLISLAGEAHLNELHEQADPADWTDEHGRVPSEQHPLGKQGLWTIPVVDEYARLVTKLVEAPLPEQRFSKIMLTHDVDTIAHFRHARGFLGALSRGQLKQAFGAMAGVEFDPAYTFPWLADQDQKVSGAQPLYFFKAGRGRGHDYPQYDLSGEDFRNLAVYLDKRGATLGLHTSYESATLIDKAEDEEGAAAIVVLEKERLSEALEQLDIRPEKLPNRWHYLRLTSLRCLQALADAGIKDDYTAGWADHVGFRLGTTRPVRWINPQTMRLTNLTLHPLSIMDCTLSNEGYMNISDEEEAYYICQQVIDKVRQHGGELVLLWHNSNVEGDNYLKQLYSELTDYISIQ